MSCENLLRRSVLASLTCSPEQSLPLQLRLATPGYLIVIMVSIEDFQLAADAAKALPDSVSNEDKLKLYGLYKQATVGDVDTSAFPGTCVALVRAPGVSHDHREKACQLSRQQIGLVNMLPACTPQHRVNATERFDSGPRRFSLNSSTLPPIVSDQKYHRASAKISKMLA
jgi:Acyl CoA binding protein